MHGYRVGLSTTSTAEFDRRLLELAGGQHYVVSARALRDFSDCPPDSSIVSTKAFRTEHEGVFHRRSLGGRDLHQRLKAAAWDSSRMPSRSRCGATWGRPGGEEVVEITAPRHRRIQLDGCGSTRASSD